ncbi:MAG: geranylgeranylglyceryl/heptaprenylglyceryl phosphate synthase [Candidatus Lokiarchaeota archaeon]|nr:geranylgeranylglyceryl/heptaprenylglyceryl phosphate synthase [Candidatus Lokiarchaeota archaeon]
MRDVEDLEDIVIDEYIERSTYEYLIKKINNEGALHFSLIDPDPLRQGPIKAAKMAKYAEDAGTDVILIGGSTICDQNFVDKTIQAIKSKVEVPIIIFPGGIGNISQYADAIFFMSLLNSSDPYSIVGQQALASYTIKSFNLEYISMAYLIIEPGGSAGWIGNAKLLPRKKPKLTAAYALAAEMFGFKVIYLEAGSGSEKIPIEHIKTCSSILNIPIIAGGGVDNKEDAKAFVEAGADIVTQGTFLENHILKDNGNSLKEVIDEIKNIGKSQKKNFILK